MLNSLKAFLARLFADRRRSISSDDDCWQSDPLSHPVLRRMTPHQLADLPFDPARVRGYADESRSPQR